MLLTAFALRLYGIRFGLPAMLDPDELIFELGAIRMLESGNGNPGWFGHPATITMYVLALINVGAFVSGYLRGTYQSPDGFAQSVFLDPAIVMLPGRIAMVCFAVLGVWLLYRLGLRISGKVCGLVAAAVLAISPLHVVWSQVVRSDILATTFLVATMLFSWRYYENNRRSDFVWACLCIALAITSKWPFAVAIFSILSAILLADRRTESRLRTVSAMVLALALCVLFTLVLSPFLILDYGTVLSNLQGEAQTRHVGSTGGLPPENLVFYARTLSASGIGLLGSVLAVTGLVTVRKNRPFLLIIAAPTILMVAILASQNLVWERWIIAALPLCALLIGIAVAALARTGFGIPRTARLAAIFLSAFGIALPLLMQIHANAQERLHDNRRIATNWASANLPAGSRIMVEHFAFDLLNSSLDSIFPVGTAGCLNARATLQNGFDYGQIDAVRGGNSNLDYGAIPPSARKTCAADFAILTEHGRYRAEKETFPRQNRAYEKLVAKGQVIARFKMAEGKVGGRPEVVVVDFRSQSRQFAGERKVLSGF
ncbi:ArnT family glycosyltransferase [Erythrobacter litoralis]|uniref:ArnT family glycosyltransferase n=1 Tax=Erythrobacter litoralis TaxID=39960 RepID=UPI002435A7D8|nr:glycosyltransferase family 39 protein [Erythrobacter litoralis]